MPNGHKYLKRTGTPGHYKYYYSVPDPNKKPINSSFLGVTNTTGEVRVPKLYNTRRTYEQGMRMPSDIVKNNAKTNRASNQIEYIKSKNPKYTSNVERMKAEEKRNRDRANYSSLVEMYKHDRVNDPNAKELHKKYARRNSPHEVQKKGENFILRVLGKLKRK